MIWRLLLLLFILAPAFGAPGEARVAVGVASVYASPNEASERVTQALLWDRVLVLENKGTWSKVRVAEQPRDEAGYPGWILTSNLALHTPPQLGATRTVAISSTPVRLEPNPDGKIQLRAYLSTRLQLANAEAPEGWTAVMLPGQQGTFYVASKALVDETPTTDGRLLVESAVLLKGTKYLWGGMTNQGIDCSGLTYNVYRLHGLEIPRDADQQFVTGEAVASDQLMPGDLLFFGKDDQHITHVGMYMWEGKFVHASSSRGGVTVSKLVEPDLNSRYRGARRILAK